MKYRKIKTTLVLSVVFVIWTYTHNFGFLDTYPRIQKSVESSDGNWKFEVYQRKLQLLNPFADSEIVFKITDLKANRISEDRLWRISWQNGFRGTRISDVRFEKDVIIVNDFWVADKKTLKFEMCPLLECLNNSD